MLLYLIACFTCFITFTTQFDGFPRIFDRSRNYVTAPGDLEDLEEIYPGFYDEVRNMNPGRHHDPREIYNVRTYPRPAENASSRDNVEDQLPQAIKQTHKMYREPESKTLSPLTEELAEHTGERPAAVRQKYVHRKSSKSTLAPSNTNYIELLSGRRAYSRDYPKSKGLARDERKQGQYLSVEMWDYLKYDSFKDKSIYMGFWVPWKTIRVRVPFTKSPYDYELQGNYVTSCYNCGHLEYGKWWKPAVGDRVWAGKLIPNETLCVDAFESDDWRARTKRRYLREECFNNTQTNPYKVYWNYTYDKNGWGHKVEKPENYNLFHDCVKLHQDLFGQEAIDHPGTPLSCFGPYTGKCFKRFLDVGKIYTERGCASWPPHKSNTFVSHRFERLEYLLHDVDEGCVHSPMASLTPFSRSVSLYVRYHVCVCKGSYCNGATETAAAGVLSLLLFATVFMFFY